MIKQELKFEDQTNCPEANRLKYLEKNKTDVDSLKGNYKESFKKTD